MDQFVPKATFLRQRALSLHKSGETDHMAKMEVLRWWEPDLPTLAYVPNIKLTAFSKYTMQAPNG